MRRYSLAVKLLCYTFGPTLICAVSLLMFPDQGIFKLILVGSCVALLAAVILARKLQSEATQLGVGLEQLEQNLSDGMSKVTLDLEESKSFLPNSIHAFEKLSPSLSGRIQTLLSSNEELRRRYSQFQSILATMAEGVLLIEEQGKILYCNRSAGKLLGRSVSEIEDRQLWEVVRVPGLELAIEEALSSGAELREEFELQRTHRIVEMNAIHLEVRSGAGMVIVFHDISELRRLEKLRREFVSNVSHELKTPLTAIQAYTDTLLDGGLEDTENSRNFVEHIQEQSDRLQQLIQDMLRLARIEAQAEVFQLQNVSLSETVAACVAARMAVARARNLEMSYICQNEDRVEIFADVEGLRTIIDNLLNNALNYTQADGHVEVRCWHNQNQAFVEVRDNGLGISQEHQSRIFERFYRVDRARSRGMGGTGLGLAIVKHCVTVFKGEIEIESEVGRGSTFRVSFPLVKSPLPTARAV